MLLRPDVIVVTDRLITMTEVDVFNPLINLVSCVACCLFDEYTPQAIANSFRDLPVSEVMRLLCFEHAVEAISFLNAYNIEVNSNNEVR